LFSGKGDMFSAGAGKKCFQLRSGAKSDLIFCFEVAIL
jgi:hypothetical protein